MTKALMEWFHSPMSREFLLLIGTYRDNHNSMAMSLLDAANPADERRLYLERGKAQGVNEIIELILAQSRK